MVKDHIQKDLDNCDIFSSLDKANGERLLTLFRSRSFLKDEIIFLKGDPASSLYVIRSGRVKICAVDRQGNELVFTFLIKGDVLGDLAIIDGKPRSATAIAMEDTDTLYLERDDFKKFLSSSPQACMGIIDMLCQRLRRLSGQLEELSFLDVAGRIARNLTKMAVAESPMAVSSSQPLCLITQEELATVIGASREMVNKVLGSFVDLGLISITRKKLTILNPQELERIASYDGGD
jgi:CRP/FNR family transcriptional regulator, cyclic AMP receptor protein